MCSVVGMGTHSHVHIVFICMCTCVYLHLIRKLPKRLSETGSERGRVFTHIYGRNYKTAYNNLSANI